MMKKLLALIIVGLMSITGLFYANPISATPGPYVSTNGPWTDEYTNEPVVFQATVYNLANPPYTWTWSFYYYSGSGSTHTHSYQTTTTTNQWSETFTEPVEYRVGVTVINSNGDSAGSSIPLNFPNLIVLDPAPNIHVVQIICNSRPITRGGIEKFSAQLSNEEYFNVNVNVEWYFKGIYIGEMLGIVIPARQTCWTPNQYITWPDRLPHTVGVKVYQNDDLLCEYETLFYLG
jgi:hypothetical protein